MTNNFWHFVHVGITIFNRVGIPDIGYLHMSSINVSYKSNWKKLLY